MTKAKLTANERDAFTRWRRYLRWKPGQIKAIKAGFNRRQRREAKRELARTTTDTARVSYEHIHAGGKFAIKVEAVEDAPFMTPAYEPDGVDQLVYAGGAFTYVSAPWHRWGNTAVFERYPY